LANHKSALKRIRQNEIRRTRNKSVKTRTRNIVKSVRAAVSENDSAKAAQELNAAQSIIAKAAKKGVLHKSTASRKISRLSKLVNTLAT